MGGTHAPAPRTHRLRGAPARARARPGLVFSTGTSSAHVGGYAPCVYSVVPTTVPTRRACGRAGRRARARATRGLGAGGPVTSPLTVIMLFVDLDQTLESPSTVRN